MVDNCSTTARLGSRKWAPRFDYLINEQAMTAYDAGDIKKPELFDAFQNHIMHDVLAVCGEMRPSVDIAVPESTGTFERNV